MEENSVNVVEGVLETYVKKKFSPPKEIKEESEKIEYLSGIFNQKLLQIRTVINSYYPMMEDHVSTIISEVGSWAEGISEVLMKEYVINEKRIIEENMKLDNSEILKEFEMASDHWKAKEHEYIKTAADTKAKEPLFTQNNSGNDVERLALDGLIINRVNINKEIVLRIVHNGYKVVGRIILCKDVVTGKYIKVALYDMVDFMEKELIMANSIIVTHPYYKISSDSSAIIRVDNCDFVKVEVSMNNVLESQKYGDLGKMYFKTGDYPSALICFKKEKDRIIHKKKKVNQTLKNENNLILCYLKMNNPEKSLEEARRVLVDCSNLSMNGQLQKTMYLEILSIARVGNFTEVSSKIENYSGVLSPSTKKTLMQKIDTLEKQFRGVFNVCHMVESKKLELDVNAFDGPFEVKQISGKGRGCVSNRKIEAGELISVSKAFCSTFFNDIDPSAPNFGFSIRGIEKFTLRKKIFQKMCVNPEKGKEILRLSTGSNAKNDGFLVTGSSLESIIETNVFQIQPNPFSIDQTVGYGLFPSASLFNHCCLSNCSWFSIADILFIVANRDIEKNEELTLTYVDVDVGNIERKKYFEMKNFTCDCKFCKGELDYSKEDRFIYEEIERKMKFGDEKNDTASFEEDLQNLKRFDVYKENPRNYTIYCNFLRKYSKRKEEEEFSEDIRKWRFIVFDKLLDLATKHAKNINGFIRTFLSLVLTIDDKEEKLKMIEKMKIAFERRLGKISSELFKKIVTIGFEYLKRIETQFK